MYPVPRSMYPRRVRIESGPGKDVCRVISGRFPKWYVCAVTTSPNHETTALTEYKERSTVWPLTSHAFMTDIHTGLRILLLTSQSRCPIISTQESQSTERALKCPHCQAVCRTRVEPVWAQKRSIRKVPTIVKFPCRRVSHWTTQVQSEHDLLLDNTKLGYHPEKEVAISIPRSPFIQKTQEEERPPQQSQPSQPSPSTSDTHSPTMQHHPRNQTPFNPPSHWLNSEENETIKKTTQSNSTN